MKTVGIVSKVLVPVSLVLCAGGAAGQPSGQIRRPAPPDETIACNLPPQFVPEGLWNANLWTGGIIPYSISASVTQQNRDRLRAAMDELESYCNIHFVPRTNQANYLFVQNGGGNNSFVGMVGGSQTVNLQSWGTHYVICHELMHALGLWHEQQRADRGNFVTINYANIQAGYESNFDIRQGAVTFGPFDFESVMMYDDCSFSICCAAGSTCACPLSCASIQALPAYAQFQNLMGNRSYMAQQDKDSLASRYGPPVITCYANCDGTGGLTGNDFQCFINAFVASASYANCDGVGGLTANDFQCYLDKFVAGCS